MLYFGIDVSHDNLDFAVVGEKSQRLKPARTFANETAGVSELIGWARTANPELPRSFVLEATAAYHELAATRLHCAGLAVSVVNPAQARSLAKRLGMLSKTDTIDALLLAQYARLAKPRPWHPVAAQLQKFNAMLMRLDSLDADVRREQNRREQAIVRATSECVIEVIDSCIAFLQSQCKALRRAIDGHLRAHAALRDDIARLRTTPAVSEKTANRITAILTSYSFKSAKEVAAFLGLVAIQREWGTSVGGHSRLSKAGNPCVRASLYMTAVVAKRINPDIKVENWTFVT